MCERNASTNSSEKSVELYLPCVGTSSIKQAKMELNVKLFLCANCKKEDIRLSDIMCRHQAEKYSLARTSSITHLPCPRQKEEHRQHRC